METFQALAGTGGRPLGTERPSANPRIALPFSGELFAREVKRATEHSRGDGLRADRLEALEETRRETRRSGFGRARPSPETSAEARGDAPVIAPQPQRVQESKATSEPMSSPEPRTPLPQPITTTAAAAPGAETAGESSPAAMPPAVLVPPVADALASTLAARAPEQGSAAQPSAAALRTDVRALDVPTGTRVGPRATRTPEPTPSRPAADVAALERAQEIVEQIRAHLAPGLKRLVLDLHPAELGRLSIQLAWRAGKVAAIVRADEPETLELLASRSEELRALFAKGGVETSELRFEAGFGRGAGGSRGRTTASASDEPVRPSDALDTETRAPSALVDTYA
jgi:hypothetical protein